MFNAMKSIEIALAATNDAINQAELGPVHPGLRSTLTGARVQLEAAERLARLSVITSHEAA